MTGSTENVWDRISRCIPARFRRSVIAPHFLEQLKKSQTVAGGPFKGMRYHGEAVCGAAAPKIMGIYEAELAPFLLKWSAVPFQHIINVGAGEGYYAVGCAMLWPQATVTAFESSEEGRRLLARNVDLNHLQSRVKILGHCEEEQLRAAPFNGQPSLVIIDAEGAEGELLGRANLPGLENAHVIVEIHDFVDNRLGELISLRLTSTHAIQEVRTRPRTFWDFHEPRALWLRLWLLPYLKQYANELRPGPMRWFCCTPVTRSHVINAQPCSHGVARRPVPVAAKEVSVPATRCLLSAKGAVSIQSLGHRPRDEIQIRTSAESASSSPQSETVPLRPITTTDIVEARLQRSLNADSTHGASPQAAIEAAPSALNTCKGRGYTARSTLSVQRKALARKFAPGLLRPFTGMNVSVRFGEIAQTILSHWPIPSQPAKPIARFRYLTVSDRRHWLVLRESLFSLYRSWNCLPEIAVVSDGSWTAEDFSEVFAWWPAPISVLPRQEICEAASSVGFPELAGYARESPYGLKLAAIVTQARTQPMLFVDADILWFRDPVSLLGDPALWEKPRALRENNCHQRREIAVRHCPQVLEPPFVNSGIVALHGELIAPELLRSIVRDALRDPQDSSCEQTIIATAVKLGGEFLPEPLSLVEFDDVHRFRSRDMWDEGYYSRHYVNWMRHLLYRDALKLRLHRGKLDARVPGEGRAADLHPNDGAHLKSEEKLRVLLVSIVPPKNDCGVRIVMHRQLVERNPFELHVASNADFAEDLLVDTPLRLPRAVYRLRKSRLGPRVATWITDYENLIWPLTANRVLEAAVQNFKPDAVVTLAECGLCHVARKTAQRHGLPLVGLFLDWFPVMKGHYGHDWTQPILSRRYRELYAACDLVFCTSDGMQEVVGPHRNSHVVYPMPGKYRVPEKSWPRSGGKFRLVYVGSVQNFYGRMLCSLIEKIEATKDLEIIAVGPDADWPVEILKRAKANGIYLGFKPPEEAASVMATADALLVVMSFESEYELFMRTSFTTKFLDYVAFGKPVILWGPDYCTPVRVARNHGGAAVVNQNDPEAIISACREIASDEAWREQLSQGAKQLHQTVFNPDRLQEIFVSEIEKLVRNRARASLQPMS